MARSIKKLSQVTPNRSYQNSRSNSANYIESISITFRSIWREDVQHWDRVSHDSPHGFFIETISFFFFFSTGKRVESIHVNNRRVLRKYRVPSHIITVLKGSARSTRDRVPTTSLSLNDQANHVGLLSHVINRFGRWYVHGFPIKIADYICALIAVAFADNCFPTSRRVVNVLPLPWCILWTTRVFISIGAPGFCIKCDDRFQ